MKRRAFIHAVARELAAYIAKHPMPANAPTTESTLFWRILALTGGGDGYSDHELDFLERAVRRLNRPH